jgi:hypothetical protein
MIFLWRAGWDVIRPRQVAFGDRRQVDLAVIEVMGAALVGGLIEGSPKIEMRPRHHPFFDMLWITSLPANGSIILGITLFEMEGAPITIPQVGESKRLVGELLQYPHDLLAVNNGHTSLFGRCAGLIVKS